MQACARQVLSQYRGHDPKYPNSAAQGQTRCGEEMVSSNIVARTKANAPVQELAIAPVASEHRLIVLEPHARTITQYNT